MLRLAYMPSGIAKLARQQLTSLSLETSIGYFFEALFQTGLYYQFLGFCKLFPTFLLFTQRFSVFGALFLFGSTLYSFMVTISMDFISTGIITTLLLFAAMTLLLGDLYRFLLILVFYPDEYEITIYKLPPKTW